MGTISRRFLTLLLIFSIASLKAESTDDDLYSLPPPPQRSNWRASAFAGCACLAVVGGIFAICWSGGGSSSKPQENCHKHHPSNPCDVICPNNVTADCMAGSCIYHHQPANQNGGCTNCNNNCELINNPPPCCANNGGVPPF